jgi:hypothetical protein
MDISNLTVRRVNGNVSANGHFSKGEFVVRTGGDVLPAPNAK